MMKKALTLAMMACLTAGVSADTDFEKLHKDAEIMQNILATALKQNNERGQINFSGISSTYLAGQGFVFEVRTNNNDGNFRFDFGDMFGENMRIEIPEAPEVAEVHDVDGYTYSYEFSGDIGEITANALEIAREALRETREQFRELRENERELNWETREFERRIRDLEFEQRHADDERSKEIDQELKEVREQMEKVDKKRTEVAGYAAELEEKEKKVRKEQKASKQKRINRFLADFEATIADSLCSYGGGLRALEKEEKVNFVLRKFGERKTRRGKSKVDKVYVFNHQDIKACVAEDISPNELLTKSKTYVF